MKKILVGYLAQKDWVNGKTRGKYKLSRVSLCKLSRGFKRRQSDFNRLKANARLKIGRTLKNHTLDENFHLQIIDKHLIAFSNNSGRMA